MFRINTNVLSVNGQRNLFQTANDLATRMERLSSGLRINRSKDDAAGLTASEGMRAQLAGQRTANDNISRAITLLQTADAGYEQIGIMLIRIKELAEQAADGTLNETNRSAISAEVQALADEINRIGLSTSYNGISLIGSAGATGTLLTFYIGDGTSATAGSNMTAGVAVKGVNFSAPGLSIGGTLFAGISAAAMITQTLAEAIVTTVDQAVTDLASARTGLGAFQNRLERAQANLQLAIENTANAESTIRDADFAAEASALTRAQILAQTGSSMLTQANVLPQLALTLISG